ncbi:MAG: hypothetical protein QNK33_09980 [Bacteroidales bacterium]|nr:hypothetical protein [Bacteroidales bacterium]
MQNYPNLLIIAGTGRNSGKTTLACAVIEKFKNLKPVGLKISPHFHEPSDGLRLINNEKDYRIFREISVSSGKDSSKMLASGASEAYYIQVFDRNAEAAFAWLLENIDGNNPIICESPALGRFVKSGLLLIADSNTIVNKKDLGPLYEQSDKTIMYGEADSLADTIAYKDGVWAIS